jgi:hypothetical protein
VAAMGSELDEKALEAAHSAYAAVRKANNPNAGDWDDVDAAIIAYRRALPAPDALVEPTDADIREMLDDLYNLHKQATVERSHYYVGSVCRRAAGIIRGLVRDPTEEQVERVALALLKATYQHYGDPAPKNPDLTLTSLLARAAIAAMREGGGS